MPGADREHWIAADDGWSLLVREAAPARPARGTVIAGHAMMVDGRTILREDRPCLAESLRAAGLRVLVPDQRGHGRSGPRAADGGRWTYDDLVADTAAYLRLAQSIDPAAPVALLGHSLFAHTALAWLGQHPDAPVRAHVALAMDVWNLRFEPSLRRRLAKRLAAALTREITRRVGFAPARRLRFGSDDEAAAYWESMRPWLLADRWCSAAGVDYHRGLARVRCPVLHVVSDGDRLFACPAAALNFSAPLPRREVWHLGWHRPADRPELAALAPDHMAIVTDPASRPLWEALAAWLCARLDPRERDPAPGDAAPAAAPVLP